jgi:hypothetical protein
MDKVMNSLSDDATVGLFLSARATVALLVAPAVLHGILSIVC